MFHVEHSPIQILTALFWGAFKQAETVGVDQLQRQRFRQLGSAAHGLPVDTYLVVGLLAASNPNGAGHAVAEYHLGKNRAGILSMLDHWLQSGAAKGTGQTKNMDGFQQTGLAAAVVAGNDVDTRGRVKRHRVQIAHRGDGESLERHAAQRRMGMTT